MYKRQDQDGELNDARVLFERKDPDGRALGALGGTRAGIGDVFTPSMALGAGSFGGRGAYYTSAPLEALDLSTPLNLRGELPLGEDVELYVNEVLQATQASAIQGTVSSTTAVTLIGPGPTTMIGAVVPALSALAAWPLLGEALPPLGLLAVLLVSGGMVLGVAGGAAARVDPPEPRS